MPHRHPNYRRPEEEGESSFGFRIWGLKPKELVMVLAFLGLGYGEYRPRQAEKPAAEEVAKLAPLYQAINEVKVTLALVSQTMTAQATELADHEARLRSEEQWNAPKAPAGPVSKMP